MAMLDAIPYGDVYNRLAEFLRQSLARVGIDATLRREVSVINHIEPRALRPSVRALTGEIHPFAAFHDRAGRAHIALSAKNHGDNRVLDDGQRAPADMAGSETIEIELARVDDRVQGPFRVIKIDTQGSEWLALQGAKRTFEQSRACALLVEFWPYALRGATPLELVRALAAQGFTLGKATAAPYPMTPERIVKQALARDPVKGGLDLYATRGVPFHVLGAGARVRAAVRSWRES